MKINFDISPKEFYIIRDILQKHLTTDCKVWVFGSRAKNQTKYNSDLDIALEHSTIISPMILASLRDDLDDSLLPYKVDIIDINEVSTSFKQIINTCKIPFPISLKKNIPQLRFPEFENDGGWEETKLGVYLKQKSNRNKKLEVIRTLSVSNSKGFILQSEQFDNHRIASKDVSNYKIVNKNDIAYNPSRINVGSIATLKDFEIGIVSPMYVVFSLKNTLDLAFFENIITTHLFKHLVKAGCSGSVRDSLNFEYLELFEIKTPYLKEQQKIANFLTAIDNRVKTLEKKKTLLEQYKKGVMQKIFKQELRFKDDNGNEFTEWEKIMLGDVFSYRPTNSLSRDKLNYVSGTVMNIHYGDIHTKFNPLFNINNEEVPFINSNVDIGRISTDNYCKKGDIIIADASEDYADIGKCIEIINISDKKVLAGLHSILARPDKFKVALGFLVYLMKSESVKFQIMRFAHGSKVLGISSKRISEVEVEMPNIIEQQKIANFLSSIDKKIKLTNKKIKHTKSYKKGLLQQMLV